MRVRHGAARPADAKLIKNAGSANAHAELSLLHGQFEAARSLIAGRLLDGVAQAIASGDLAGANQGLSTYRVTFPIPGDPLSARHHTLEDRLAVMQVQHEDQTRLRQEAPTRPGRSAGPGT